MGTPINKEIEIKIERKEMEAWIGPYNPKEEIIVNHTCENKDTYTIRAKDTNNLWGPWGELEINITKNQQLTNNTRFLERFILFR